MVIWGGVGVIRRLGGGEGYLVVGIGLGGVIGGWWKRGG